MNYKNLFNKVKDLDLETTLRVEALERLLEIALDFKHKDCFNANKLLLQSGWNTEDNTSSGSKGRPSKEAIRQEVERLASLELDYKTDLERINNNNEQD